MLKVSYRTTVTLCDLFECRQKCLITTFELVNRGRRFLIFKTDAHEHK